MKSSAVVFVTIFLLGLPTSVVAQRARVPVRVQFGWSTSYQDLASVPADSEVLEGSGEKNLDLCFVYDQFWLVLPFWSSNGSFAVHRTVVPPTKADSFWVLKEQDSQNLAKTLKLPEDRFTKPFLYRVPFGWLVMVGIVLFVNLTSGPSPEKRFARLWSDERYRKAIASLVGYTGPPLRDPFEPIILAGAPPDAEVSFADEVQKLRDQGVSRRKAGRDLEFLLLFLANNGGIVQAEWSLQSDREQVTDPGEKPGVNSDS
jgi:hypothetical protein